VSFSRSKIYDGKSLKPRVAREIGRGGKRVSLSKSKMYDGKSLKPRVDREIGRGGTRVSLSKSKMYDGKIIEAQECQINWQRGGTTFHPLRQEYKMMENY